MRPVSFSIMSTDYRGMSTVCSVKNLSKHNEHDEYHVLSCPLYTSEEKGKKTGSRKYYPGQKNRYSREIHEVDLQVDHVISSDIERQFDIDATRVICASRARVALADRSRCRMISHDCTAD